MLLLQSRSFSTISKLGAGRLELRHWTDAQSSVQQCGFFTARKVCLCVCVVCAYCVAAFVLCNSFCAASCLLTCCVRARGARRGQWNDRRASRHLARCAIGVITTAPLAILRGRWGPRGRRSLSVLAALRSAILSACFAPLTTTRPRTLQRWCCWGRSIKAWQP